MTGLFALFVAAIWFVLAAGMAYGLASRIKNVPLRLVVAPVIFGMLLPLPLVDEFAGKRQFEQLCKDNATIQVDRAMAVGKTVYLEKTTDVEIRDTWVRIVMKQWRYVDVNTGEPVVSYNTLEALGGRLVQSFGFSEGRVPLTFANYYCGPKDRPASFQAFEALGIKYIEPPNLKNGELK